MKTISDAQRRASYILSGLPALFLLIDGAMKLFRPAAVIEATTQLGYHESVILPIGVVLLICTILYLIPRTNTLGAILLTGYLGGAVNTHVRAWQGWFPVLFPVVFGVMLWGGLYLREQRLSALLPLTSAGVASAGKLKWGGYVLSALPALLLVFSASMKLSGNPQAVDGFRNFGYQAQAVLGIGILELSCTVLYLIPRTAVLGAILLAGYMGGAIVTHMRVGEPFIVQALVGVLLWGGLFLRDERLRALLPLHSVSR
ncbi:MAG: DoxX family protein [Blastocatellia bacterium]